MFGCSNGAGNGPSGSGNGLIPGLSSEEPRVEFVPVLGSVPRTALQVQLSGYKVNLSGTDPNGQPYTLNNFSVKGAGLQGINQAPYGLQQFSYPYMSLLAKSGANCIRCYGAAFPPGVGETPAQQAQDIQAALQWATQATSAGNPMFVVVGITMGTSSALNYSSPNDPAVLAQRQYIEQFVDAVEALDNSRQLGWIIGNELCTTPGDAAHKAVYTEVDLIASYIRHGSNLPTSTAVPQVSEHELQLIHSTCPHLDVLCVNAYHGQFGSQQGGGQLNTLPATMANSTSQANGWKRPYIVSEFGSYNLGASDLPTVTLPNTPAYTKQAYYGLEANSTLVAADYLRNYNSYIKPYIGGASTCVGSFAYVWQNPVYSSLYTYFYEMFLTGPTENPAYNPQGMFRLQAVDSMVQAWGGTLVTGPYPQIVLGSDNDPQGINCSFKATASNLNPTPVAPGVNLTASLTATYASPLSFNWYLLDDTALHYNPQNYAGVSSTALSGVSHTGNTSAVNFTAPSTPGNYQLRVTDNSTPTTQAPAATAAVMFVVK